MQKQVAEKRKVSEQSYLQNISSYISYGFSSYLPTGLKKQLPNQPEEAKEKIIWLTFDIYEFEGESRQCLLLAYVNGFQIWDVQDPDNTFELVSKREGAIKCAKFLHAPLDPARSGRLTGKHPVIALASADDSTKFPRTAVKLYSLREQEYINTMRFRSDVYDIICSQRMLVVVLNDHIYGFDTVTMEKIISTACFPHDPPSVLRTKTQNKNSESHRQIGGSVVALGTRWLAYPGTEILPNAQDEGASSGAIDNLVEVAKYIGDVGIKTVSSYMYPESQMSSSIPEKENGSAGTVVLYDICTRTVIAHFKAHRQPIATLSFDPSGTLLVTASIEGYHFNVFQINPISAAHTNYHHIYTLARGRTTATITSVSFSNDSRWMAASTTRGTTHIYAINPEGGPVSVHTHIPSEPMTSFEAPYLMNYTKPKHLTLAVCNRIKQEIPPDLEETSRVPYTAASFRPLGDTTASLKIMTISQLGMLLESNLLPHPPSQPSELDPKTLLLDTEATFYWDICRRSNWAQSLNRLKSRKLSPDKQESEENEHRWLANVEICTHTPYYRPLWAGPQFTFKTIQKGAGSADIPTEQKIKVRYTPLPVRKRSSGTAGDLNYTGLDLETLPTLAPSASPEKEEIVKADITDAMATPLEVPHTSAGDSGFISDSYLMGKSKRTTPVLSSSPLRDRPALSFPDSPDEGPSESFAPALENKRAKGTTSESLVHFQTQPGLDFYYDDDEGF